MAVLARNGTIKSLVATLVALLCSIAVFAAPAAADVDPADRGFARMSIKKAAKVEKPDAVAAQYSCSRSVPIPAYYIDISCTVYSGAIRIVVTCSDGYSFASPIIFAGNQGSGRGTCGPPYTVRSAFVETIF